MRDSIAAFRKHLALPKTSWQICLLAIVGGAAAALLVVLFTFTIEQIQQLYLIKRDNYNSLDEVSRFDLPIIGAIVILFIAWLTGYKYLRTGIPFVLHRLKVAHGIIPFKNTLNQFWGSAIALASGFSVGREGPAVHLGAACSSFIGERLRLPYNSIRTLCACGIAAGIAATFNTPIAAVIFVMEVILREYKIHIFIPIMLSALVGSLITQSIFGPSHGFQSFNAITIDHQHYFALVILAVFLGILAAAFNKYLVLIIKHGTKVHIIPRLMLAAVITGALGYLVPSAMGTGVSAIDISLENHWQIGLLLSVLVAKILMTISALGLGIPGGIIGPVIGIGAIAGAFTSALLTQFMPGIYLSNSLGNDFILMGMAGFMAATLNAPLAALLAVLELSGQLDIVVPAMITITVASITSRQLCRNRSIFSMQLDIQQLIYQKPPIEESLQKIGVLAIIKDQYTLLTNANQQELAESLQLNNNDLLINQVVSNQNKEVIDYFWIEPKCKPIMIAPKDDSCLPFEPPMTNKPLPQQTSCNKQLNDTNKLITTALSGQEKFIAHKLLPLSHQATLAEAYLQLVEQRCGGVYIYHNHLTEFLGVITFEQLRVYLVEGKLT